MGKRKSTPSKEDEIMRKIQKLEQELRKKRRKRIISTTSSSEEENG